MKIADLFDIRVEEKIEPVIKVGETSDEHKLASEIGSYVVTPLIERHLDDFLEHYTDTFLSNTTEIGVWISGYFGSGKSHLAKVMALLCQNRFLEGVTACERFAARIPTDSSRHGSITRSLGRMPQCDTELLAFNLNSLQDSRNTSLPALLLSQYYMFRGYSGNRIYARVIEAELDKQGKLASLHAAVEKRAGKRWTEIQQNLAFYRKPLYESAAEVAPESFPSPQDVERALKEAEQGELYNVSFLMETILSDLNKRQVNSKRATRLLLVLDESGQWIENSASRLAQLQALIEEASARGQGHIWIIVTTHGDMGSVYKEARAVQGDMKKIEGRFRFKPALTTENIELVLEDRLFRKTLAGRSELESVYVERGGVLRGIGELANTEQALPACTAGKFNVYYPFFPYHIHLIPEIVKGLRSKGGRGEQMTGSTRTLLGITQDILRAGRRPYLEESVGTLVSFDEVYNNLVGEGEINPDVRTEISRIKDVVPGASLLTQKVAEVLYLIRELAYIPRTKDNIARLLALSVDDDIPQILNRIEPEFDRLLKAKMVAKIGEEYEFLTGERRTFEDELATVEMQYRQQDRELGFAKHFIQEPGSNHWRKWLDFDRIPYSGSEFGFRLKVDETAVSGTQGHITLEFSSPLKVAGGTTLADVETQSLQPDEGNTLFFVSGKVRGFDQDLTRFLAMREIIRNWVGDAHRSEDSKKLAMEREGNDLPKLERKVLEALKEGIRNGHIVFKGGSRPVLVKSGTTPGAALQTDLAAFWPQLYPKFERVPIRIADDQKAIQSVLAGTMLPNDVKQLKLYDSAGKIDPHSPLLDAIRIHMSTLQSQGKRILGHELLENFESPPYGWDPNSVRVGIAALVRAGTIKVLINKKPFTNPADRELAESLRVSRSFAKLELILEDTEVAPEILTDTRAFLIQLAKKRGIDETPAALSEEAGLLARGILDSVESFRLWASGSQMPMSATFSEGEEAWKKVQALTTPSHRVREVYENRELLRAGFAAIEDHASFQKKNATQFTELKNFHDQLKAIEYRLNGNGTCLAFIRNYKSVVDSKSFTEKESWKTLQNQKAQATVELTSLVNCWRTDTRELIDNALARIPSELAQHNLDGQLVNKFAIPLRELRDTVDSASDPIIVANLPSRATEAVRTLGSSLQREISRKALPAPTLPGTGEGRQQPPMPPPSTSGSGQSNKPEPLKQTRKLRPQDVSFVTVIHDLKQWDALRDKLDERVRELIRQGYEVDLS
jgi:hypothetical protein